MRLKIKFETCSVKTNSYNICSVTPICDATSTRIY